VVRERQCLSGGDDPADHRCDAFELESAHKLREACMSVLTLIPALDLGLLIDGRATG